MSSQLKLTDITKKFEANTVNEKVALDHLNLTVEPGQFVTVLGSNGSGKSTMFNVILGSLFPDEGKVYLGDKDITKLKDYKRALNIGCLYQNPLRGTAPNLTIEENLALAYTRKASPSFFALNKKDSAYFREVLSTLGMGLEDRMKTKIGLLSGGQRQAASLLMATIAEPELLLLDEHTAALDPGAAEKVMALTKKIVEENKITTLMITHDMEYALEYGSRTIMLDNLDFPLTNSQLSEFFVNHGYTSYFHLQQAINELVESEFVRAETIRNTTNYHLISSGKEALSMFHTQISEPIKNDILDYFAEKKYQLRKEVDITADYYPLKKKRGEYMVKTQIKEKGSLLLELNINVVSKEQAIAICDSWEKKSDAVYGKLMEMLLLDE